MGWRAFAGHRSACNEESTTMIGKSQQRETFGTAPSTKATDLVRVEAKRKTTAERQRKSDTDGRRRREKQIVANNQLV